MIHDSVVKFLGLLRDDPSLAERLRPIADPDEFDRMAAQLGRERGLDFTAADLRAAIDDLKSQGPSEVSEEDLAAVAGGVGCPQGAQSLGRNLGFGGSAGCVGDLTLGLSRLNYLVNAPSVCSTRTS